ncbi:hypothetical protein ACT4_053_00260 [Acinetobacter sp. NBRC 100985]|nr:hypothetical protein ACT4_053_00260 [Acinetobacter sp. NBRC 100985]
MFDWIRNELEIYAMLMSNRKHIWLIPLGFFSFCLCVKLWMLSNYENYMMMNGSDAFGSIVTMVYEKSLHRIDKIAFFGSLVIFIILYKKARNYF